MPFLSTVIEVPEWAIDGGYDFKIFFGQYPKGFRAPPISLSNCSWMGTQLGIGKGLHIGVDGRLYLNPRIFNRLVEEEGEGEGAAVKWLESQISIIPEIWSWGREILSEQDGMLEELNSFLPYPVGLSRYDRCSFDKEYLSKIKKLIEEVKSLPEDKEAYSSGVSKLLDKLEEIRYLQEENSLESIERRQREVESCRKKQEEVENEWDSIESQCSKVLRRAGLV